MTLLDFRATWWLRIRFLDFGAPACGISEHVADSLTAGPERPDLTTKADSLCAAVLVAMDVVGLGWAGTRTDRAPALARFYEDVLGLRPVHTEPDFWVFELPDGRHVEVFGANYPGKSHW